MKKLPLLILKSYLGPFIMTFAIAMVFLILQFLWKYVDDLMGKGLEWYVILELLFYASANLVPMALPLAILLSSIMIFGNLAESSELTAMKAAGMSLLKIMRPLIAFILVLSFGAFIFANYIFPVANMKFRSLIFDIQRQKPTISIKEAAFYNDIEGFSIRVNDKGEDGKTMNDILIYDHTKVNSRFKRSIRAKNGYLAETADKRYLQFHLNQGKIYQEIEPGSISGSGNGFQTIYFEKGNFNFDLQGFELERTSVDVYEGHFEMLNMSQLEAQEDTLKKKLKTFVSEFNETFEKRFLPFRNYAKIDSAKFYDQIPSLENLNPAKKRETIFMALSNARSLLDQSINYASFHHALEENIARHRLEWHRKLTLSAACIILFFIGAPLGAIIRKGGLGAPIVASTLLFIFYYIVSIAGEKMAKTDVLQPFWGMWMSAFILFPIGFWLTYKSNTDSVLFDRDFYIKLFRRKK